LVLLCTLACFLQNACPAEPPSLVPGNTAFALDLYRQLKANPSNLFFSPYSISTALAMTYGGARGQTAAQMIQVLHLASNQDLVCSGFAALQNQLHQAGQQQGIELNVANALWAQKGHPFLPNFLQMTKTTYEADVNQADFTSAAESARAEINGWVAQKTRNRIQDALPPDSLDAATRMVLVNAIYFKGIWKYSFSKELTFAQPFHLSDRQKKDAPLMVRTAQFRYMEDNVLQAIELPYQDRALSMVVILPRKIDGCANLESQFTPALLSTVLRRMQEQDVAVFLPRFKLASGFSLKPTLAAMGMSDAFGANADFSGMDGGAGQLFLEDIFHKAWGEVNEEGTEAAAATATQVDVSSEPTSVVSRK
jgi:serine protease inhibitor